MSGNFGVLAGRKQKVKIKTQKFLTAVIFAFVILTFTVVFLLSRSHGRITTSQPIQIYPENAKASVSPLVQEIEPVVAKTAVIINGKKNMLLCTFQDRERAMQSVKKRDAEFLQLMKNKWKLDDLNSSNWKDYQRHLTSYTAGKLPEDLGGDKYEKQRYELEGFFGIYEDDEINRQTLEYINFANFLLGTRLVSQVSLDPVTANFPYGSPLLQEPS